MESLSTILTLIAITLIFLGSFKRRLLPYIIVGVLGLEYFSPSSAQGIFTIPKVGFGVVVLTVFLSGKAMKSVATPQILWALVFLSGYLLLGNLWSINPTDSITRSISLVMLLLSYWIILRVVKDVSDIEHFITAFLIYGISCAGLALYEVLTGTANYIDIVGGLRSGGIAKNPSEGAFYMGIAFMILVISVQYTTITPKFIGNKKIKILIIILLIAGILSTSSRGGIVAIIAALLLTAITSVKGGSVSGKHIKLRKLNAIFIIITCFLVVLVLFPDLVQNSINRGSVALEDRFGSRIDIWLVVLDGIMQSPIYGNGLVSAYPILSSYGINTSSAHNTFLQILVDGGIIALLLFSFVLSIVMKNIYFLMLRKNLRIQGIGYCCFAIFTLTFVFMQSMEVLYYKLLWIWLALLGAMMKYKMLTHKSKTSGY